MYRIKKAYLYLLIDCSQHHLSLRGWGTWQQASTLHKPTRFSTPSIASLSEALDLNFYIRNCSFCVCADTQQIRMAGRQSKIFVFDFDFTSSQMQESNPGRLGEKRTRYLCAMPSPQLAELVSRSRATFSLKKQKLLRFRFFFLKRG